MTLLEVYEEQCKKYRELEKQIKILERKKLIKRYRDLMESFSKMKTECHNARKAALFQKYNSCNHIWTYVNSEMLDDEYYGCVKCGLDGKAIYFMFRFGEPIVKDGEIMFEYFDGHYATYHHRGTFTEFLDCTYEEVYPICQSIMKRYPDIDNETLIKYIRCAIYNMKKKEKNKQRKLSK